MAGGLALALHIFALGEKLALRRRRSLRDQIDRAALSVSNNIAEGFERGTTKELLTFLYIARGSAGEVRSMLCLMEQMSAFGDLKSEISDLKSLSESISRQLHGWAQKLKDTDVPGPRYLTTKTRQGVQTRQQRDAFLAELRAMPRKN